jgi:hypothetical protein
VFGGTNVYKNSGHRHFLGRLLFTPLLLLLVCYLCPEGQRVTFRFDGLLCSSCIYTICVAMNEDEFEV